MLRNKKYTCIIHKNELSNLHLCTNLLCIFGHFGRGHVL